ncbi:unnamed protein product [Malus baccata var. baccata]
MNIFNSGPYNNKESVLEVVHKHGLCNQHKSQSNPPDQDRTQILKQDEARVSSIHYRLNSLTLPDAATNTIPVQYGLELGSSSYIVTVGLGTPAKNLSLLIDTSSDLTWTQCRPCVRSCYKQKEPMFDPSHSTSYSNISCESAACSQLTVAGIGRDCSAATCTYSAKYLDNSSSLGFFGNDKLTLTPTDAYDDFDFGCAQNSKGQFGAEAGLLGLGRTSISFVEQTSQKYKRVFSYCLPSTSSSTGYLKFGPNGGSGNTVKFTPLKTLSQSATFYALDLVGITIGSRQLKISASVFSKSGTVIDSGTVITRLPATPYAALRAAFRKAMEKYPFAKSKSALLDTCYDFSGLKTVSYPKIGFVFGGGVTVDLDATGILFQTSGSQFCLAFAGNKDDNSVGIIGNVQQKRLQVVYDVAGGRIGFGPAVLCSLEKGFALAGRNDKLTHHTVQLNSLLPATTCTPSTKGHNKKHGSVLEVVHRHGPCYEPNQQKTKTATDLHEYYAQFFKEDQARVDSIYSRLKANKRYSTKTDDNIPITQSDYTNTFPAPSATTVGGSGNYVVKVGLGTPAKSFSLIFDTGSDLTWTQCQPCRLGTRSDLTCYNQTEPIYDPSLSTSYANISCNTATCNELTSATNNSPDCYQATNTCVYLIGYGDNSTSVGYYGTERLTLTATSTDMFDGFLFGCGQDNEGLFVGIAGLLGLGRNKISLIEQTAAKYGRYFSYCLPVDLNSTGFLRLGKDGGNSAAVKFTPLTTLPVDESFYGLDLDGISVSGQQVSIASTVFSTGTVIDSGTVITRLPAAAYTAMRDAFREGMKSYGEPKTVEGILDTCYDLRAYNLETVSFPAVAFTFSGGLTLELKAEGTVIVIDDTSQVCLAILPITKDQPGIIGNYQQRGFEVVYDVAGGKIGFATGSC